MDMNRKNADKEQRELAKQRKLEKKETLQSEKRQLKEKKAAAKAEALQIKTDKKLEKVAQIKAMKDMNREKPENKSESSAEKNRAVTEEIESKKENKKEKLEKALSRVRVRDREWCKLDNAALIFPSAGKGADTQVFRFSCELFENVSEELLQEALNETIKHFDIYRYIMKRGLFWYYLEKTDLMPVVRAEYKRPCSRIYRRDKRGLLFEVTYFNARINLEVFHVLSDGTGAMNFFKSLVTKYLCLRYKLPDIVLDYDASRTQMKDDSFAKYYSDNTHSGSKEGFRVACRLKGMKLSESRMNIITGHVSVSELLSVARNHGVTVTAFLCACLIEAIASEASNRAKKRDIVISVPVNLRKYFPSESARNFFSIIFTSYNFSSGVDGDGSFESIIKKVGRDLKDNLSADKLSESINSFSAVEHNFFAKITPLPIKDICLGWAYDVSMLQGTATVSNIGIFKMSDEIKDYIRSFDVYTGTNKLQICFCTYLDTLSINITSPFVNTDVERLFFRKLSSLGIGVELYSNLESEEDDAE